MRALALTLETIATRSSTEGKVQSAAAYLASQPEARLPSAARFLAGAPLPPGAPATRVGRSTMVELVSTFTGRDRQDLLRRATQLGDLGLAVAEVLEERPHPDGPRLGLEEVAEAVEKLGAAGTATRGRRLRDLIGRTTPLEAKYLTKLLLGSMRTGIQATRVEEAIALAFDKPLSSVRRSHMLLGDIGATAAAAFAGSLDDAALQAFRPVRVMLAHACDGPSAVSAAISPPVIAEDKYDGIRAQLHTADGVARLYSRALEDFTHCFPEIRDVPDTLSGEWILDGEVVAWLDGQALSFATLQRRLGRNQVPLTLLLDAPVIFLAFDVLRAATEDLIDTPLAERKAILEQLPSSGPIRRAPWESIESEPEVTSFFDAAIARGNEGAVFKSPDSKYRPGTRGRAWVKLKRPLGSLDVVVTGAEWGRGKRAGMLSDLIFAVRGPEGLVDAGRAYSGLTDGEIRALTRLFKRHTLRGSGAVRRVEPEVVIEVAFDDVRPSARHPSGYALRFPRIVRRRVDLTVEDISTLADLESLCAEARAGVRA